MLNFFIKKILILLFLIYCEGCGVPFSNNVQSLWKVCINNKEMLAIESALKGVSKGDQTELNDFFRKELASKVNEKALKKLESLGKKVEILVEENRNSKDSGSEESEDSIKGELAGETSSQIDSGGTRRPSGARRPGSNPTSSTGIRYGGRRITAFHKGPSIETIEKLANVKPVPTVSKRVMNARAATAAKKTTAPAPSVPETNPAKTIAPADPAADESTVVNPDNSSTKASSTIFEDQLELQGEEEEKTEEEEKLDEGELLLIALEKTAVLTIIKNSGINNINKLSKDFLKAVAIYLYKREGILVKDIKIPSKFKNASKSVEEPTS